MGIQEIKQSFHDDIESALHRRYGPAPNPAVTERVREEWAAMEAAGDIEDVAALYDLALWMKEWREPYWLRGTPGASLILYLLGITAGNPLPPHYYCPQCHAVRWISGCRDGFDLPPERCENDGTLLCGDGHDVPCQTHWGPGKEPGYEFDVPETLLEPLMAFFKEHWLAELRPGTEFVRRHADPAADPRFMKFSRLSISCVLDPGKISPDFYDIAPDASCVPNAAKALQSNLDAMDDLDAGLRSRPVYTFADIIAKYGLAHSTGAWDRDAQFMADRLGYGLSDLIAYRDDVFFYLLSHGFPEEDARDGMERVRLGHELPIVTSEMSLARDKWVIERCKRVKYLYPKAHAVEHILYRLRAEGLRVTSYRVLLDVLRLDRGPNVVLLAARPGMGKTAFARYLSERLSTVSGKKAAYFSQEEMEQKIDIDLIRDSIDAYRPDFVIVDSLQAVADYNCTSGKGGKEMVSFMAGIRALSDETKIPVLVISGLDRKTDRQKNHMPGIGNIFLSADIVPYADAVMFLYRAAYYDPEADPGQASCVVAKAPGGMTCEVPLLWDEEHAAFGDAVCPSASAAEYG
ncbi:DnaB-like helicase C-terminal domain-containing protein [uncultured Alistipes sp.]|uniref:DnaB-like helicase C-terminal domain-containing protein n=1 Tax=uncultured Alistipes sp. TaxID=538949 RepID=UPI00272CDDAC|nr:DnaB-like helicase C-terminal domain-containing protein [uncultured Alistipes sp.]